MQTFEFNNQTQFIIFNLLNSGNHNQILKGVLLMSALKNDKLGRQSKLYLKQMLKEVPKSVHSEPDYINLKKFLDNIDGRTGRAK